MSSFFESQVNYCPRVGMFHDRMLNSQLNLIPRMALRLVCTDSETENKKLIDRSLTIHQQKLQLLIIEIYKTKHSLNQAFMKDTS